MSEVEIFEHAGGLDPGYTMEQVVEALTVLVNCRGNLTRAAEQTGITAPTLSTWAQERFPDRYMEIEERFGREIEQRIVMEARETAFMAGEAERKGIQQVMKEIEAGEITGRELAQATYALSKIKSTNIDKVLALTGRPTNPQGKGSVADALGVIRELQSSGLLQVVNEAQQSVQGTVEDGSG
jgi:hypothetical protein